MANANFTSRDLQLLESPECSGESFERLMRALTEERGASAFIASLEFEGASLSTTECLALEWAHRGLNTRERLSLDVFREWHDATSSLQWDSLTGQELTLMAFADDCLEACLRA